MLARHDLANRVAVLMGGRTSEALIFDGEVFTGAAERPAARDRDRAAQMVGLRTYSAPPQPFSGRRRRSLRHDRARDRRGGVVLGRMLSFAYAKNIGGAKLYGVNDAGLPLTEVQFRTSLTAENMVQASQGVGGPQPAEVARMLATQKAGVEADRAWLAAVQGPLTQAAERLDVAFGHLTDGQ